MNTLEIIRNRLLKEEARNKALRAQWIKRFEITG